MRNRVKVPSRITSRPGHLVCPVCGSGELHPRGLALLAGCDSCSSAFDGAILRILEQIAALPDAHGKHACECGHPEMRRLPDGTFHCPACGSEVLPILGLSPSLKETDESEVSKRRLKEENGKEVLDRETTFFANAQTISKKVKGGENHMTDKPQKIGELSPEELEAQTGEALPDREEMSSLVDVNVAAPVNLALAANVLSDNSTATATADQTADIIQF